MAEVIVRNPVDSDFTEWRVLWKQYLVFYETVLSERHTESLWQRSLHAGKPVESFFAQVERRQEIGRTNV